MGEYATYSGKDIKIGTCEEMYYLRFDQRHKVQAKSGNVNPVLDAAALRFRFPWPDEDGEAPGAFEGDYERGLTVYEVKAPQDLEHASIQFSASQGYLCLLPCPESSAAATVDGKPLTIHRNGFRGAVNLVQQRWTGKHLAIILRCACGAKWRATPEEAQKVAASIVREAETKENSDRVRPASVGGPCGGAGDWLRKVAARVMAGYATATTVDGRTR